MDKQINSFKVGDKVKQTKAYRKAIGEDQFSYPQSKIFTILSARGMLCTTEKFTIKSGTTLSQVHCQWLEPAKIKRLKFKDILKFNKELT